MELLRIELSGLPLRVAPEAGSVAERAGILGVDLAAKVIDGTTRTVVQLLVDDDRADFDRTLLDGPLVAEITGPDGLVARREPFDHDRFRHRLRAEREAGESTTRGVLAMTDGELPPPWIRLAFVPIELSATAGSVLVVRRTTVDELIDGTERAYARGDLTDDERRGVLISIDQLHPSDG